MRTSRKNSQILLLRKLFDADWYGRANPDVVADGRDLLKHYLADGWREGRQPHPLFDPTFYTNQAGCLAPDQEPFSHYLAEGWKLGLNPHILFDVKWYLGRCPAAALSGENPLVHYVSSSDKGASPHPLFDPEWYQTRNSGVNGPALLHYVTGRGQNPHPLFNDEVYLASAPDVALIGLLPLKHYLMNGYRERLRLPNILFDADYYIEMNPNCSPPISNPLIHYVLYGSARRISPHPLFDPYHYEKHCGTKVATREGALVHYFKNDRANRSTHPLFNQQWYLSQNPDIIGMNALEHYLQIGWRERRKPSPDFDIGHYLRDHPSLSDLDVDPFLHYVRRWNGDEVQGRCHAEFGIATSGLAVDLV